MWGGGEGDRPGEHHQWCQVGGPAVIIRACLSPEMRSSRCSCIEHGLRASAPHTCPPAPTSFLHLSPLPMVMRMVEKQACCAPPLPLPPSPRTPSQVRMVKTILHEICKAKGRDAYLFTRHIPGADLDPANRSGGGGCHTYIHTRASSTDFKLIPISKTVSHISHSQAAHHPVH